MLFHGDNYKVNAWFICKYCDTACSKYFIQANSIFNVALLLFILLTE